MDQPAKNAITLDDAAIGVDPLELTDDQVARRAADIDRLLEPLAAYIQRYAIPVMILVEYAPGKTTHIGLRHAISGRLMVEMNGAYDAITARLKAECGGREETRQCEVQAHDRRTGEARTVADLAALDPASRQAMFAHYLRPETDPDESANPN